MSGIFLDTRPFLKEFQKITMQTIPDLARKGLFNAAAELLNDSDRVEPKTPLKEGHLKGSKKIEISVGMGETVILAGFNIDYASYVHEMVKKHAWTEPGSGPKFLESKLLMFKNKYIAIAGETVARGAAGKK